MSDLLAKTYELHPAPPPALPWEDYVNRMQTGWQDLLASHPSEREVQAFLERHPSLVPGAHVVPGQLRSGHAPFPCSLVTQPTLTGLTQRTPDFLWMSSDSLTFSPVFVELEAPDKPWLTAAGYQSHQLTQALHQVDEWSEWFGRLENRQVFLEAFEVPSYLRQRKWSPVWLLVYGRRDEDPEAVSRLRSRLQTANRIVMAYEHLRPDRDCDDYLCVRRTSNGYRAVTVPPTVRLGPSTARDLAIVAGKAEAAAIQEWVTPERREFLADRFSYWDEWAQGQHGLISTADRE